LLFIIILFFLVNCFGVFILSFLLLSYGLGWLANIFGFLGLFL
jgi:hypothetical protein